MFDSIGDARGEPPGKSPSGWDPIFQAAGSQDWSACRALLLEYISRVNPESVPSFAEIGKTILKVVALSASRESESLKDLLARIDVRAEEISRELKMSFPGAKKAVLEIQVLVGAENARAMVQIASKLRKDLGLPTEAVETASRAIALEPSNIAAFTTRASALVELGQLESANLDLVEVAKRDPKNTYIVPLRAKIKKLEGDPAAGLRIALRAFHDRPSQVGARQVGSFYQALGNGSAMHKWYEVAEGFSASGERPISAEYRLGLQNLALEAVNDLNRAEASGNHTEGSV